MKKLVNVYYNLFPAKIYKNKEGYFFFINYNKFYIKEFIRPIRILDDLVEISNNLFKRNLRVNTFIVNKDKKFFTEFNKKNYVILKVNDCEDNDIDITDIINFNNMLQKDDEVLKVNIVEAWKKRIDNIESKLLELNNEYPLIQKTANYYLGLAENAVSYMVDSIKINSYNSRLVLSHSRFKGGLKTLGFYDPLLFVFDYITRDISMYIKIKYFNSENILEEIENFLNNYKLNEFELRSLFARLLYPDYYFDCIERIINEEETEDKLKKIINKYNLYEIFLFDMYIILKKRVNLPEIEWLINEKT